ncbi:TIM barrel protein [uncultured Aquimarina sp.]|uniref:sugar phosphate isomerase/epimerase family protein n=1 Tax=uncultured Aquimarina sp. TaxID=575652 RepID=UPI00260F9012|nr:TIM barrel protein [uncultured Aquimarina sp.]
MNRRIIIIPLLLMIQFSFGQEKIKIQNQNFLLQQYIGEWYNGDSLSSLKVSDHPNMKILVTPKMNGVSLFVEVFQKKEEDWVSILSEVISYDANEDQIVALGTNTSADNFIGKGYFSSYKDLVMTDYDFQENYVQEVTFCFEDDGRLSLKGDAPGKENDWEGVYFRKNNLSKNFGIHLVSVDVDMKKDPVGTIEKIGKMGYSFVETHRYDQGHFYGFTPKEFRLLLKKNNLRLEGSMVFKDLDTKNPDETMKWWDHCIEDQIEAGVKYITTTNINLELLRKKDGLKKYASYFNTIGKKCKEKGIRFLYHNHKEEFQKIRDTVIYDYILENTDPSLVYFQSDLFWMHEANIDPIYYFKNFPGRFISWHVKDKKELGASGKIDFEEIFKYARKAGLQYNIVEVESYNYPPLISVRMAADFMRFKPYVKSYN